MNKTIFSQLDSRWASLPYPTKNSSFGGNGCGCCACTHVAIDQPWKADYTPNSLRKWMIKQGYAVSGKGTMWSGIEGTLKHLGHKEVVWVKKSDPMSKAWKELNKGNRIGVLLVDNSKTADGTVWTSSGHYVMFYRYRYQDGKHYFWIKDSGGRKHSGKFCYETSIKGALPQLWIVERIKVKATNYKPSTPYSGLLPNVSSKSPVKKGTKGARVKRLQKFLNWAINGKLDIDGVAGEQTDKAIRIYQKTYKLDVDGEFGPASKKKAQAIIRSHELTPQDKMCAWAKKIASEKYHYVRWKENVAKTHTCPICNGRKYDDYYGWNCIGFAWASWHHGAGLKSRCSCSVFTDYHYNKLMSLPHAEALALAKQRIGLNDIQLLRSASGFNIKDLKAGDIIIYFTNSGYIHTALCVGNGLIADCTSTRTDGIKYGVQSYTKWKIKAVIRYTGK